MLLKKIIKFFFILILFLFFFSCKDKSEILLKSASGSFSNINSRHFKNINKNGNIVKERILLPEGYKRAAIKEDSFAGYLRNFSLKPHDAVVETYNGDIIPQENLYVAVFDMDVGKKDLQQCADAIIRIRAEYLYFNKEYSKINFTFTNGYESRFVDYAEGIRVKIANNKVQQYKTGNRDYSYNNFKTYLVQLFIYAGTYSISREMASIENIMEMKIGDVFVQGGSPGHAVIVIDMAENINTKEKIYLLAQSYMPAQSVHILVNRNDLNISPWYKLEKESKKIITPNWLFTINDLKRFK